MGNTTRRWQPLTATLPYKTLVICSGEIVIFERLKKFIQFLQFRSRSRLNPSISKRRRRKWVLYICYIGVPGSSYSTYPLVSDWNFICVLFWSRNQISHIPWSYSKTSLSPWSQSESWGCEMKSRIFWNVFSTKVLMLRRKLLPPTSSKIKPRGKTKVESG
jgi:hypothetical protein